MTHIMQKMDIIVVMDTHVHKLACPTSVHE